MIPAKFKQATRSLGKPENWPEGVPCNTLDVMDGETDGVPHVLSFWSPTPEELAVLNAGGFIALRICGTGMPPVAVYTVDKENLESD